MNYKGRKYFELIDKLDAKILLYAINNVDWDRYDPEEYDGESAETAWEYLSDIENQICEEFGIEQ